jgi:hypothetical protein
MKQCNEKIKEMSNKRGENEGGEGGGVGGHKHADSTEKFVHI